ncbi:hypothetical protein WICPIJ_008316 [Wickerhamomyces pijperi]|uniref:Uncharacterized protein n=1 Tax=Wickerhamomyces pijperi TaxID=599730 RepID=A0A9P8PXJ6_WICPI|nr:hypothetical protein WICPIJ_008316 [Wickerhamomyces pijperi]
MATSWLMTISALVLSVAVTSMNTFLVLTEILEASEFIIGVFTGDGGGLVQWDELDVLLGEEFVGERWSQGVQVVGTHGHQSSVTAQVGVELVLQRDEGLVRSFGEGDVSQDGSGSVWSQWSSGGIDGQGGCWSHQLVRWSGLSGQELVQRLGNTFDT